MLKNPFQIQVTADGSPTLWDGLEQMHSRDGAFSETEYVYGRAIDACLEKGFPKRFLCLGLGLGYIEALTAAKVSELELLSFEKDDFLRTEWHNWLTGQSSLLQEPLDQVVQLTSEKYEASSLKEKLQGLYKSGQWQILGDALTDRNETKYSTILFDAFSKKSTPDLWNKDFLIRFLNHQASENCIFTTYAATGELKRTLKEIDFVLIKTEGFGNKKESTFALREQTV